MKIDNSNTKIIPSPQNISIYAKDTITLPQSSHISFINIKPDLRITTAAKQLCEDLKNNHNCNWSISYSEGYKSAISAAINKNLRIQEYKISSKISTNQTLINIEAGSIASICFAIQTIRQLIMQYGLILPSLQIQDFPEIPVRAYSYDVSRGRVPKLSWLKTLVDQLSLYKYNQLQLYVEHVIDLDDTIESWIGHSPLTCSEIIDLDEYCYARGIELVPTLATFGHMYEILRSNSYKQLGEFPEQSERPFSFVERMMHHTLNPTNPNTIPFISKRIKDYASLFKSNKFNIGADETFDLGCGESKNVAEKIGVANLYLSYIKKLCEKLHELDLQPIMYADIAIKHPELLADIPKNVIFANWDYSANVNENNIKLIKSQNRDQYVCPGTQSWNRLIPDFDSAISNISKTCEYGHKNHVLGFLLTDWGDYGHINDPILSLPYVIISSEYAWKSNNIAKKDLINKVSNVFANRTNSNLLNIIKQASHAQAFSWSDAVQFKELEYNNENIANEDVLFSLGYTKNTSLEQARRRFLNEREAQILNAKEYNRTLSECSKSIYDINACSENINCENINKDFISTSILNIQGQQLLNQLGLYILNQRFTLAEAKSFKTNLNEWFTQYQNRWESIGKTADLYRIREVLDWYIKILGM